MPSSAIVNGQTIAGKYRVEGVLGRGAMGVVLAARHLELQHLVAIKVLSNGMVDVATARARFLREARLAARIRSDHVCRVLDTGAMLDGTPFFVMEYLDGVDLSAELQQRGRLEPTEAVGYVQQVCEALSAAHASGVVHRDLKPANIFLLGHSGSARLIKVLDFGVSKALVQTESDRGSLTNTAVMIGSPLYMSPEQLDCSRDVDTRSDLWALGVILYELLAGEVPFNGNTLAQVVTAVLQREPPLLATHGVTVPSGLENVIRCALSKSPRGRYACAEELSHALAPFGPAGAESELRGSAERERYSVDDFGIDAAATVQALRAAQRRPIVTTDPAKRSPRRRALQLISLCAILFVGAALAALWLSRVQHAPESVQTQIHAASLPVPQDRSRSNAAGSGEAEQEPTPLQPAAASAIEPAAAATTKAEPEPVTAEPEPKPLAAPPAPARNHVTHTISAQPRSVAPAALSDPLEIPGFGGRR